MAGETISGLTGMVELRARYVAEAQRWGETVIVRCTQDPNGGVVTIKTVAFEGELAPGLTYTFLGKWKTHFRWGRQFHADSFSVIAPHDEAGVIAYLVRAPRVGPAVARSLWKHYGSEAVRELREAPATVAAALKLKVFSIARAQEAAAYLAQEAQLEDTTIGLMSLLTGRGFPRMTMKWAIRQWGAAAARLIHANPYLLMRFRGCGFVGTDQLYLDLKKNPARLKRQALAIWHGISRDSSGSTWFSADFVSRVLSERLAGTAARPIDAVKLGRRAGLLSVHRDQAGKPWITEASRDRAEFEVAQLTAGMTGGTPSWPAVEDLPDVSDHQRQALAIALTERIGIFCGGPGTGKTFSAARLIARLLERGGSSHVAVVAPTGKAAVRITEALQGYGVGLKARTIHSFLGVLVADQGIADKSAVGGGSGFAFEHGAGNPVDQKFVIVDESSMIDVALMRCLLSALPENGHLLLVGDVNQLPPVSHGAPFRDLIAAGIPAGELTEIRRNSGEIVETCARIRKQERFEVARKLDLEHGGNLMLRLAADGGEAAGIIVSLLRGIRDRALADPVWETQVLVAVNEKSALSRRELNPILQAEMNGHNRAATRFWPRDKIICLKNQFLPLVAEAMEDGDGDADESLDESMVRVDESGKPTVYVANGELGRCIEDLPGKLVLEFSAPRRIVAVPKGEGDALGTFDLGYAISCHKCVSGDTIVETDLGLMRIDSIPGSSPTPISIATPRGGRAFHSYVRNPDGNLLCIRTEHGYEVTVTPDHGLWAWNGSTYEKRLARDLIPGDFLRLKLGETCVPSMQPAMPKIQLCDCRAQWYRVPGAVDADVAEFLGLMVADGTVWKRGFRLLKRHPEVGERFRHLCNCLFGVTPRPVQAQGASGYEVNSTMLASWVLSIDGLAPNQKGIPSVVLASRLDDQAAFLRGLFEDGTVNMKGDVVDHIEFSTSVSEIARVVQIMLLRFGIISTRKLRASGCWSIYIYSESLRRFAEKIGFISKLKNSRLNAKEARSRFVVPTSKAGAEAFTGYARQNARFRGHATRSSIQAMNPDAEELKWHHVRIKTITKKQGPSYCVTVPGVGRFLQNGFDGSNSQGSEWPIVIVAIDDHGGARYVCDRAWLYTAISRARKVCMLVGDETVARGMVARQAITARKTFLVERIATAMAESAMVEVQSGIECRDASASEAPAQAGV